MEQKSLISTLVVVVFVLGIALAFMMGQKSIAPESPGMLEEQSEGNESVVDDESNGGSPVVEESQDTEEPAPADEPDEPALSVGGEGDVCMGNDGCESGLYCAKVGSGVCNAETTGTCKTKPSVCALIYSPACGCDGKTYSNSCAAASAGVNVSSQGACS